MTARILLVSCYELGHQPLGIAWPAALLRQGERGERRGESVETMDLAVEPFDDAKVARADTIYIHATMHTARRLGERAAERMRRINPRAAIEWIGYGWSREREMVKLVPDRRGLPPLAKYVKLAPAMAPVGYVETTKGCKHLCRHCPIPPVYHGRFFAVPREVVMADIRQLVAAGARHITFGDPDFLNGPTHALRIVRQLVEEFPGVTYDFTAKIEHLLAHRALLEQLERCAFVVSAVESLSDHVLAKLHKGHTRADVHAAFDLCDALGLVLRPTFVAFTPWTTRQDYVDVLEFVESRALVDHVDPVQYTLRLLVPPGSLITEFGDDWVHPDPGMDALQRQAAALVEAAAEDEVDPAETFARLLALARPGKPTRVPAPERPIPARLTEPWFC